MRARLAGLTTLAVSVTISRAGRYKNNKPAKLSEFSDTNINQT